MCCRKFPLPRAPLGSPTKSAWLRGTSDRAREQTRDTQRKDTGERRRAEKKVNDHEVQNINKCRVVVNTAAVWVGFREKVGDGKKGELEGGRKKWREERKGVQPIGIVWVIRLSSKKSQAAQTLNHTDRGPLCTLSTATWWVCRSSRDLDSGIYTVKRHWLVLLWILVSDHPPWGFTAQAIRHGDNSTSRVRPTVQWDCRMEYDIDFYKHFAWLRKVRRSALACTLLIPSHCTTAAHKIFAPAVLLLLRRNYSCHGS